MRKSERPDHHEGERPRAGGSPDPERDRLLANAIRQGDVAAFTTIFGLYYAPLVRYVARYVASLDAAEDVVQELFTKLWERRDQIDPARSFRAYLFTLARNRAVNVLQHDAVVSEHAVRVGRQDGTSAAPAADAHVLTEELNRIVAARVATLSPRLQEIYHLSRDEGLSTSEIATLLGIANQTVYLQLTKVIRILYDTLEPWVKDL